MAYQSLSDYSLALDPEGSPLWVRLEGDAKRLRTAAPYFTYAGVGTGVDPLRVARFDLNWLLGFSLLVDHTGPAETIFAKRLSVTQLCSLWDIITADIGTGGSPDLLELGSAWHPGALAREFVRRRNVIALGARRSILVVDVLSLEDNEACTTVIKNWFSDGLQWSRGSAFDDSGGASGYAVVVYVAPHLASKGGVTAPSRSYKALHRLELGLEEEVVARLTQDVWSEMEPEEKAAAMRKYLVNVTPPHALLVYEPASEAQRLSQTSEFIARRRCLRVGGGGEREAEWESLPRVFADGTFFPLLSCVFATAPLEYARDGMVQLAQAAGASWKDLGPLGLAGALEHWISEHHKSALEGGGEHAVRLARVLRSEKDRVQRLENAKHAGRQAKSVPAEGAGGVAVDAPMAVLPSTEMPALEKLIGNAQFSRVVAKAESMVSDVNTPDHSALYLMLSGSTGASPGRPFALLAQIGWGHVAAGAVQLTARLGSLSSQLPLLVGQLAGAEVDSRHRHLQAGRFAKQLAANDWGGKAAKAAERSVLDFVGLFNFARRTWSRAEPDMYMDPAEADLYTRIEHLLEPLELAMAIWGMIGLEASHPRSWRATVDAVQASFIQFAPSSDSSNALSSARRRGMGVRLRELVLGLFHEKMVDYNRFRRGSDVAAVLDGAFRRASSPSWDTWLGYVAEMGRRAERLRAEHIDTAGVDDAPRRSTPSQVDSVVAAERLKALQMAEVSKRGLPLSEREEEPTPKKPAGVAPPVLLEGGKIMSTPRGYLSRAAAAEEVRRLGKDPSDFCLNVLLMTGQGLDAEGLAALCKHAADRDGHRKRSDAAHSLAGFKAAACKCNAQGQKLIAEPASGAKGKGRGTEARGRGKGRGGQDFRAAASARAEA